VAPLPPVAGAAPSPRRRPAAARFVHHPSRRGLFDLSDDEDGTQSTVGGSGSHSGHGGSGSDLGRHSHSHGHGPGSDSFVGGAASLGSVASLGREDSTGHAGAAFASAVAVLGRSDPSVNNVVDIDSHGGFSAFGAGHASGPGPGGFATGSGGGAGAGNNIRARLARGSLTHSDTIVDLMGSTKASLKRATSSHNLAAHLRAMREKQALKSASLGVHDARRGRGGGSDALNIERLQEIMQFFEDATESGHDGLDIEAFVYAFRTVLGGDTTDRELRLMFMKVDANSDGTVDWEEFSNFMLLENEGAGRLGDDLGFAGFTAPDELALSSDAALYAHRDTISRLRYARGCDRYISTSRDGLIRIWDASRVAHVRTIQHQSTKDVFYAPSTRAAAEANGDTVRDASVWARLATQVRRPGASKAEQAWVTDLAYLEPYDRICVASMDQSLTFYDLQTGGVAMFVDNLPAAPLCLDFSGNAGANLLSVGDDRGGLTLLRGEPGAQPCDWRELYGLREPRPLPSRRSREPRSRLLVSLGDHGTHALHRDWVTRTQYLPDMNAIISCSLDATVSVFDLDKARCVRTLGTPLASSQGGMGGIKVGAAHRWGWLVDGFVFFF
jgi:hypothetical protein